MEVLNPRPCPRRPVKLEDTVDRVLGGGGGAHSLPPKRIYKKRRDLVLERVALK